MTKDETSGTTMEVGRVSWWWECWTVLGTSRRMWQKVGVILIVRVGSVDDIRGLVRLGTWSRLWEPNGEKWSRGSGNTVASKLFSDGNDKSEMESFGKATTRESRFASGLSGKLYYVRSCGLMREMAKTATSCHQAAGRRHCERVREARKKTSVKDCQWIMTGCNLGRLDWG